MSDLCTAESCGDAMNERPGPQHLIGLFFVYGWNTSSIEFMAKAMAWYVGNVMNVDSVTDLVVVVVYLLYFVFLYYLSAFIYAIPSFSVFVYALTNAKFFPFRWSDNLAMWSITRFALNVGLWYKILVSFFFVYMVLISLGTADGAGL